MTNCLPDTTRGTGAEKRVRNLLFRDQGKRVSPGWAAHQPGDQMESKYLELGRTGKLEPAGSRGPGRVELDENNNARKARPGPSLFE